MINIFIGAFLISATVGLTTAAVIGVVRKHKATDKLVNETIERLQNEMLIVNQRYGYIFPTEEKA